MPTETSNNELVSRDCRGLLAYARKQVRSADRAEATAVNPLAAPHTFPGYQVVRIVHQGGQGAVYESVQEATGRRVAIKLMYGGRVSGNDEARFQREVEVISKLKHASIVTLHDGGIVGGQYYLVMDYVEGRPLDEFLADAELTTRECLELFLEICRAAAEAHVRGIMHRDLKPSNIHVDDDGSPHLLDFGLAKVVDDTRRVVTETGEFVGSLAWSSPEQAAGRREAIDVRTDVYALGLVLFFVLTKKLPYDTSGPLGVVVSNISMNEPLRPSSIEPGVDDDIDTIVLKCLSKEPVRRYESAGALARDIERYLAGEPISAKADSWAYVLRKLARRHRVAASLAAVMPLVMLGWGTTYFVLYRWADSAEKRAELRFRDARETVAFLVNEVSARLEHVAGARGARKAILEAAYERLKTLASQEGDSPALRADLAKTFSQLGDVAMAIGSVSEASQWYERSLEVYQELAAASPDDNSKHADVSIALVKLGDAKKSTDNRRESRAYYERALEIDVRIAEAHPEDAHYSDNLGWSHIRFADMAFYDADLNLAETHAEAAASIFDRLVGREPESALRTYGLFSAHALLMAVERNRQNPGGIRSHLDIAGRLARRMLELEPENALYLRRIGGFKRTASGCLEFLGDPETAVRTCEEASEVFEMLVEREPERLEDRRGLCSCHMVLSRLLRRKDLTLSIEHGRRAVEIAQRLVDITSDDPAIVTSFVRSLVFINDHSEQEAGTSSSDLDLPRLNQRALQLARLAAERENPMPFQVEDYAELLRSQGKPAEAAAAYQQVLTLGGDDIPGLLLRASKFYRANGQVQKAIHAIERAVQMMPPDSPSRQEYEAELKLTPSLRAETTEETRP